MDSWEKMDQQQLPPKEAFHSKVSDSDISDEDYEHAQNVGRTFNIHTNPGYHYLYMMSMLQPFPLHISFIQSLFLRNTSLLKFTQCCIHFCIVDVLILADVFEKFRSVSMEQGRFEVDPAHYLSAPQMAWDAMLKKRDVVLYLITDLAMYLMIESGMRGGVCMKSKRHA